VSISPPQFRYDDGLTAQEMGGSPRVLSAVQGQELTFAAGERLTVSIWFVETLDPDTDEVTDYEVRRYSYDFRRADDSLLWRYDKHTTDHHDLDALPHVHSDDDDAPAEASEEVDIEFISEQVRDYFWPH
jgi:hypothetical protein